MHLRLYEINVKATNLFGRSRVESASVIIVPMDSDGLFFNNGNGALKTPSFFINLVSEATTRKYSIQTVSTQFDIL